MANNGGGMFIATTFLSEMNRLNEIDVNSREFKDMLTRLYRYLNDMAIALNTKQIGYYSLEEYATGNNLYPVAPSSFRPMYRQCFNIGSLPNTATLTIPHGITTTPTLQWVKIYGAATNTTTLAGVPLPFVSLSGNSVEIDVDGTNIYIISQSNMSAYNAVVIVLEYSK